MASATHRWRRVWPVLAAGAAGVGVWIVVLGMALDAGETVAFGTGLADLAVGLACVVLIAFRHRAPVLVAVIVVTAGAFSVAASGATAVAMISLATRRRPIEIVAVSALGIAAAVSLEYLPGADPWVIGSPTGQPLTLMTVGVGVYAVFAAIGVAVGARRAELAGLRREAASLRAEQDAIAEQARLAERTRVATEVHDELGHRLSVIAVHAAALEYRDDLSTAERHQAAAAIRSATTQAMSDLRSTLSVLTEEEFTDTRQGWAERLERLADDVRQAGSPVELSIDPPLAAGEAPPVELTRHLFRITQECLTNALRHAPGEPVQITISGGTSVRLRAYNRRTLSADDLSTGSGRGLVGITERVRLAGGNITITPGEEAFIVEVELPWTR